MKKLAIIGSADLAVLVIHQVLLNNRYKIFGIYDDFTTEGNRIADVEVKGKLDNIKGDFTEGKFDMLFVAVGYSRMNYRAEVFARFKNIIPFANIIHDSCIIDPTVELGEGILLFPDVLLDKGVKIEDNVLLNLRVTIAHNSIVQKDCFLAPCVSVAGFSIIGSMCYIGTNATIINNIKICSSATIGGGTVIIKDIREAGTYVGVPARKLLKNHVNSNISED